MKPTFVELLTGAVALTVVAAVAIPLWRSHELRARRADGIEALEALQKAQDRYFGTHARYADARVLHGAPPDGLGVPHRSPRGFYEIEVTRSADALGYLAVARANPVKGGADVRCVELRLDQLDRRRALDDAGADTTADCWSSR
jgi:type IV pilus assembly protein PilE